MFFDDFCWFFECAKNAQRPYDHFGGGIAPRSLLCVRKRRFPFCGHMSKFCVRFAKNDHREPCVTVCPSEKWSSSLMCCPAVCWHMSWIPEKMIIIRHVLATCVWERCPFLIIISGCLLPIRLLTSPIPMIWLAPKLATPKAEASWYGKCGLGKHIE